MFEAFARSHGIDFVPLPGDPTVAIMRTAVVELGNSPFRMARWLRENLKPVFGELFRRTLDAVEGADLVVSASLSFAAFHVAEKLGIPAVSVQFQPSTLTREHPGALVPQAPAWFPLKTLYNLALTKVGNQTIFQLLRPLTNECRRRVLGLPPLSALYWWNVDARDSDIPMIYAYSPEVLPRPRDWGAAKHVTGYWFLDQAPTFTPSGDLEAFLEAGPTPVYVGVGSIIDHHPDVTTRIVIDAAHRAGRRVVLQSGWSGLGRAELPRSVFVVDDVPHHWLFPKMAAVVHHGGAGTTATGLRAGLPTVIVPFFGDQYFWAWRVHELGVGPSDLPRGLPRKRLSAERLAAAVDEAVTDDRIRHRAQALSERLRAEDGAARAVTILEEIAAAWPR
jgi:sterol 3beta-glucosyltransferase